jgi:gliding motility-associated-like protein
MKPLDVQPQTVTLCDNDLDGEEIYDLTLYESTVADHENLTFSYYKSNNDASQGKDPIPNPDSFTVSNGKIIYVKISKSGFCAMIKTITISFKTTEVSDIFEYSCEDTGEVDEIVINIYDYYNQMASQADITLDGFYLSKDGAVNQDPSQLVPNPENFVISSVSTIYVRFFDNTAQCNFIREIKVQLPEKIEKIPSYNVCDMDNDGQEDFELSTLNSIFQNGYPPSSVIYYATLEDYNNDTNPITKIQIKGETTIYVRLQLDNSCFFFYQLKLNLASFSPSQPETIPVCDDENDKQQNYNLTSLITLLGIEGHTSFAFYQTEDNAYNEKSPITNTTYTINATNNQIYVRANYSGNCPKIIPVKFTLLESVKVSNLVPLEICDKENNGSETVDLSPAITQSGIDPTVTPVEFYLTQKGAELQTVTELIENYTAFPLYSTTTVYVRFGNPLTGCFVIRPLLIKLNPFPVIAKTKLDVCDFANDGEETISLSKLNSQLVTGTYVFNFSYYLNEEDAINLENAITEYTLNASTELYVRVSSGPECSVIQKISFSFVSSPTVYDQIIEVCDNNADDEEDVDITLYENLLTGNDGNTYSYKYFTDYDNAYNDIGAIVYNINNYNILKFPVTFYVRITDNSDCFSIAKLTFEAANIISADNKVVHICDLNFTMTGYVNLTLYIEEMLISTDQDLTISYYSSEEGANTKDISDLISDDPDNYPVILAHSYVWIRFENPVTKCYTVRYVEIYLDPLPKLANSTHLVCDVNFDNIFSLDLDELRYDVINNPEGYTFSYYHTHEDAAIDNKIENIHNYIVHEFTNDIGFTEEIIVRGTSEHGCSSLSRVTLYTKDKITVNPQAAISNCDDSFDGITSFDLTSVTSSISEDPEAEFKFYSTLSDAQNQTNPITNPGNYQNIQAHTDKAYVRISSLNYCPSLSVIDLTVLPLPVSTLKEEMKICPDGGILELDAGSNPNIVSYSWNTGETTQTITINQTGTYSVIIVGTNGCQHTYTTNVTEYPKVVITDLQEGKDYITVIAEGPHPLEYSMDNTNWQSSNTFYDLTPGVYTFYVRSMTTGCLPAEKTGVIFNITNVITPNEDGRNDAWRLCGLEHFDSHPSHIQIFDRYGREVFSESSTTCFTWDGRHSGKPLPTTSYWYIIEIADGRQFTGWILLRNHSGN